MKLLDCVEAALRLFWGIVLKGLIALMNAPHTRPYTFFTAVVLIGATAVMIAILSSPR